MENRVCVKEEDAYKAMGWSLAEKKTAGFEGCAMDYGLWGVGGLDLSCTKLTDCPKGHGKGYCAKITGCVNKGANSAGYCVLSKWKTSYDKIDAATKKNIGLESCSIVWGEEGDPDEKEVESEDDGSMAKLSAAATLIGGIFLMQ